MRQGLVFRMMLASGLLVLLLGTAFVVLVLANRDQRDARQEARDSRVELAAAERLRDLVLNLETGQRGFVITREESFLGPWNAARAAFPEQARSLVRLVDDPERAREARRITEAGTSYIRDYSVPLVNAVRRGQASTRSIAATEEGKRRVDALRAQFARFTGTERALVTSRQDRVDDAAGRALTAATVGLAGSMLLILFFTVYLMRAIVRPVRRASGMAVELAGGDLAVRMPETGTGEIGTLERAFNTMGSSLQANRAELLASRARVVAAADHERRRVVRDLHDGAQQRLVHAVITLKLARRALEDDDRKAEDLVNEALVHAEHAISELRELSHGILPSTLTRGGLQGGVDALVSRISLPVTVDVSSERLTPAIEATAYFVVSEALTNAVKHSEAKSAEVRAHVEAGVLRVEVRDDGIGGVGLHRGSGLLGLDDRVTALGGRLRVESPDGGGTLIAATIPLPSQD